MVPLHMKRAQQVTTTESSRTTVCPPGAGLLTWLTLRVGIASSVLTCVFFVVLPEICALNRAANLEIQRRLAADHHLTGLLKQNPQLSVRMRRT